jgi:hypothetical protein
MSSFFGPVKTEYDMTGIPENRKRSRDEGIETIINQESIIQGYLESSNDSISGIKVSMDRLLVTIQNPQILQGKNEPTIKDQILRLSEDNITLFNELIFKYRFLYDYIDLVHDFKICVDFLNGIFISTKVGGDFKSLINRLCSGGVKGVNGNIRVLESYELQLQVLKDFIKDLQELGLTIPDSIDKFPILKEKLNDYIKTPKSYYRESGRGLQDYSDNVTEVLKSPIGMIDGCLGKCATNIRDEKLWKQILLGFIEVEVRAMLGRDTIIIMKSIPGRATPGFENVELKVKLSGKITLDNVLKFLPSEISAKAVRDEESSADNITIESFKKGDASILHFFQKPDSVPDNYKKYFIFFILLKTICDKTIISRIHDYEQLETVQEKKQIDILCTTDSYVPTIPIFEYLCGNIDYCTEGFLSNKSGWNVYFYPTVGRDNKLLSSRFFYLLGWLSQINYLDIRELIDTVNDYTPLLTTDQQPIGSTDLSIYYKISDYFKNTSNVIQKSTDKLGIIDESLIKPETLWDYLQTISTSSLNETWKEKREIFFRKIREIADGLKNRETDPATFLNLLLSVPTRIDIDIEVFEILNQSDIYTPFDDSEYFALIYEQLLNQILGESEKAQSIKTKLLNNQDLEEDEKDAFKAVAKIAGEVISDEDDTFQNILQKIKKRVIKENIDIFQFLLFYRRSENLIDFEIIDDGKYLLMPIAINASNSESFKRIVGTFNQLNEDSANIISVRGYNEDGYPANVVIPLTAEFLINILIYFKNKGMDVSGLINNKIGDSIYNIMEKWIRRRYNLISFKRFLIQVFKIEETRKRYKAQSRSGGKTKKNNKKNNKTHQHKIKKGSSRKVRKNKTRKNKK